MNRSTKTRDLRHHALTVLALLTFAGAASAALGSCFFDTKTTLCEATGLRCKPGQACAADQAACIDVGGCGDGFRSNDETCDDGNVASGDGCSADCTSDESCGNSIIDTIAGEFCDDGNLATGDGCNEQCRAESCGDFVTNRAQGEECDSGAVDSEGCNSNCKLSRCGDGHYNTAAEDCETPLDTDTATCDGNCTARICGDSYTSKAIDPVTTKRVEVCDAGGDAPNCNGNGAGNGGGAGACQIPKCGDSYVNVAYKPSGDDGLGEACDAGRNTKDCNGNDHDNNMEDDYSQGESVGEANCQMPACGDGYVNPAYSPTVLGGEQCEDGNSSNNDDCPSGAAGTCRDAICGDGFRKTTGSNTERCDTNGDVGCDPGYECRGCNECVDT
jgi:cysteine-rich repeat protein